MLRPGQAAAAEASRRRAAEACADAARERLGAYWSKQRAATTVGLPPRWTDHAYYRQAERDARELAAQRKKEKNLEERRNKLAMMLFHEDLQQKEELKMFALQMKIQGKPNFLDSIPTSKLREVNIGIRAKEEERRRQEAEILLYHQWRANQPAIREFEVKQRQGALRSAWMEQIVEKEIAKKKEDKEDDKILKERENLIRRQMEIEKEALLKKEGMMKDLQEQLCDQIQELRSSETAAASLKKQEEAEVVLLDALRDAGEVRRDSAKRRAAARAVSLSNMAMQARRLKERAREAEKDVEADIRELFTIKAAIEQDILREESNRKQWHEALENAMESFQRQKELEKSRQRHLDTVMDGEARAIYEKQEKTWQQEHKARQALLNDVLATLKRQVEEKLEEYRKRQRQNILDRELMLVQIEKANKAMEETERGKQRSEREINKITNLQSEIKQLEREEKEKSERKERVAELKEVAREEERLRREIIRLQKEGSSFQMHRRRRFLL